MRARDGRLLLDAAQRQFSRANGKPLEQWRAIRSASASTTENAPALDDELILVKGGADMPQQVSDWLAENA